MRAVLRTLQYRLAALLAVAAAVAIAAGFAASLVTAWGPGTVNAASEDIHRAPQATFIASQYPSTGFDLGTEQDHLAAAIRRAAPSNLASVVHFPVSDMDVIGSTTATQQRLMTAVDVAGIRPRAQLSAGTWPGPPAGGVVPAAVPEVVLVRLGLHIGDQLTVTDLQHHTHATFEVTGSYRADVSNPGYWLWDLAGGAGIGNEPGYTLFGPFAVDAAAFGPGGLAIAEVPFVVTPALGVVDLTALTQLAARLNASIGGDPSNGLVVTDGLSPTLAGVASRVRVDRDQLLVAGTLAAVLAGAAFVAAGSRLVARGADQAAVLRSRGLPRGAIVAGYLPDAVVLIGAAAAGVAVWSVWSSTTVAVGAVVAAGAVTLGALSVIGVSAARTGAVEMAANHRRRAAAPMLATGSIAALACLAAAAAWEARNADLATQAGAGTSVVAACAPALAALAGAMIAGRAITAGVRVTERAGLVRKRLPAWLATSEIARTPARYLGAALACVAVLAGGVFALADHGSLERSASDQAAYATGADVAVDLPQPLTLGDGTGVSRLRGVLSATPVVRIGQGSTTLVAVDAPTAAATVAMRPDFADRSIANFWRVLSPARDGIVLPGHPTDVRVSARLTGPGLQPVGVTVTIEDATGLSYQIDAGHLAADGTDHTLSAAVPPGGTADYPLRLIAIALSYQEPPLETAGELSVLTIDDGQPDGQHLDATAALAGWTANAHSDAAATQCNSGKEPFGPSLTGGPSGGAGVDFASGHGMNSITTVDGSCLEQPTNAVITVAAGVATTPLPVAATSAYLDQTGLRVGATTTMTLDGVDVPVRIVERASAFPTVPANQPSALITDIAALSGVAVTNGVAPPDATTWWLHTTGGTAPAGLPPGAQVTTSASERATLLDDPLAKLPAQAISGGVLTLLLLGVVSLLAAIAAAARAAAARDAVLAALGVTRRQRIALACLSQVAVTVPAVALGVALGWLLTRLLVTSFILNVDGLPPLPHALPVIPVSLVVALAAGVVAIAIVTALAGSLRRSDPAAYSRTGV